MPRTFRKVVLSEWGHLFLIKYSKLNNIQLLVSKRFSWLTMRLQVYDGDRNDRKVPRGDKRCKLEYRNEGK